MLGTVTIHCHVTSKLVKLQGSRLISGNKAPVWFFDNVLANTFAQEGTKRKSAIELDNRDINNNIATDANECTLCDKKYKTTTGLQKRINTKHAGKSLQSEQHTRKRKNPSLSSEEDEEHLPPTKSAAVGFDTPRSLACSSLTNSISTEGSTQDKQNVAKANTTEDWTLQAISCQ